MLDGLEISEVVSKQILITIGSAMVTGFSLMLFIDEIFKIIKQRQIFEQIEIAKKASGMAHVDLSNMSMLAKTPDLTRTAKERRV